MKKVFIYLFFKYISLFPLFLPPSLTITLFHMRIKTAFRHITEYVHCLHRHAWSWRASNDDVQRNIPERNPAIGSRLPRWQSFHHRRESWQHDVEHQAIVYLSGRWPEKRKFARFAVSGKRSNAHFRGHETNSRCNRLVFVRQRLPCGSDSRRPFPGAKRKSTRKIQVSFLFPFLLIFLCSFTAWPRYRCLCTSLFHKSIKLHMHFFEYYGLSSSSQFIICHYKHIFINSFKQKSSYQYPCCHGRSFSWIGHSRCLPRH